MFLLHMEEMERSEITLVKIIHYRQLHQDFLYFIYLFFYNATTQNKRKIDRAIRGAFGKYVARSFFSVTDKQTHLCLVSFLITVCPLCQGTNFIIML